MGKYNSFHEHAFLVYVPELLALNLSLLETKLFSIDEFMSLMQCYRSRGFHLNLVIFGYTGKNKGVHLNISSCYRKF